MSPHAVGGSVLTESLPPPHLRSPNRTAVLNATPLDGLLNSNHQARVVWDFCRGLDLSSLLDHIRSRQGRPGRPALDPRLAIALWVYATLEGVGSARALTLLCAEHNAFRWLCGGVSVNHHTLADVRVRHLDALDGLLTHSVAVLREQGLVDLNRVAQDGTRVRASAGAASPRPFTRLATSAGLTPHSRHIRPVGYDPAQFRTTWGTCAESAASGRASALIPVHAPGVGRSPVTTEGVPMRQVIVCLVLALAAVTGVVGCKSPQGCSTCGQ